MSKAYSLIHVILPKDKASKVLKEAKKEGIKGGTIYRARGTVNNKILQFFSIYEEIKDMLIMLTEQETAKLVIPKLVDKFNLTKPNTGIIFTTEIEKVVTSYEHDVIENKEVEDSMFRLITTIVDRGKADDVVDSAKKAGARGATVLHARGSGNKETLKLFNMEIEPEKEVVLIVADTSVSKDIIESINNDLELDKPGKGVIFAQKISEAHGIYGQN